MSVFQSIIILTLLCNMCALASKLIFVNILYRHGARTPFFFYPTDPYKNYKEFTKLGKGQLTDVGKIQEINLGKYLYYMYPYLLTDPWHVHVQSTEDKRVRESAVCNLAAMFPDYGRYWTDDGGVHCSTQVPILVVPKAKDNVLQMEAPCLAYQYQRIDTMFHSLFEALEKAGITFILKILYKYAGLKEKLFDYSNVYKVYDTLLIEGRDLNLPLKEWTKAVYPEPLKETVIIDFTLATWNDKMKLLKAGPLLKEMISNMDRKIRGEHNLNAYIYTAHDSTIVNLLNTLGVYDGKHLPDYAACVMMELWQDDDRQYYVKLYYKKGFNYEREELLIPMCGLNCYLTDIRSIFNKYLPTDWQEQCNMDYKDY